MKKASRRSPERDRFVRVARLRRIIGALSGALDGDFDSLRIEIDGDTGKLVEHDGEGNHAVAFWNEAGVVALQYEHDVPEAHGDTSPASHLAGVPKQLVSLAEAIGAFEPRRATRGAWALGDEAGGDWFEMHMLEPHTCPADEVAEMESALSTAVVLRAEEATRVGTYTMSEADFDAVFATKAPNLTHVPRAVTELERAGVLLPDAIERTKALAAALRNVPPKHGSQSAFLSTPVQGMMPRGALGRDRFVEIARLRRLFDAFGGVHGGALDELDVETTGDTGKLVVPGKTQVCVATWNATGLVAIVFDVRRPKTKKGKAAVDSAPTDVLDQLPAALADLAASAKSLCPGIPVDAVWAIGNDASRASPLGIRRLECFTWPRDAVVGFCSVMSPKLGELVLRVERATREATYTMTEEDASVVSANRPSPHPANVTAAVRALERAGVLWPGIIERVQRVHDEAIAARKLAEEPLQDALLRAAFAGDLPAVRAALEAGAAIDCVTYDGMFEWNVMGATPLWLAIRKGHFEVAEHLLRSGADVNRASKNGCQGIGKCTPLRIAAAFGHPGLVRQLLERDAGPLREERSWGMLQAVADGPNWLGRTGHTGTLTDYAAVIRMLLDAGVPLPSPDACDRLRQMVEAGGAPELGSRLVPPARRD